MQNTQHAYEDEAADAARDMLRLFTRAILFVAESRLMRKRGDAEWWPLLSDMRRRLSEAIVDDCLLFEEPAMLAVFDFLSIWRTAAYEHDVDKQADADMALEKGFRKVVMTLSSHLDGAVAAES